MPPKILLSVCGAGGGAGGAGWFSVSGGVEDVFDCVMYGLEVDSSLSGEVAGRVSSPTNSMDGILWGAGRARPCSQKLFGK